MSKTGNLSINSENIFPIIKKWLYSDHDIFARELISNGCDAITKLKKLALMSEYTLPENYKGKIEVVISAKDKTMKFIDNGLGMTADEVEEYITQIAFSGATDFLEKYKDKDNGDEIIGHFGLGFYSAFMVADEVHIDTLSYQKDAQPVHWTCDGGTTYTIEEGNRTEVGTEITLFLNEESLEFANEYRAREVLEKYCSFMPTEIFLTNADAEPKYETIPKDEVKEDDEVIEYIHEDAKTEEKENENGEKETVEVTPAQEKAKIKKRPVSISDIHPLWTKHPNECTDEEYRSFYRKVFLDYKEPLFWIHLNMDYPFNLKGILYFPKINTEYDSIEGTIKLYNNQVFIADNIKEVIPEFLMLLKGVIDCPDLPLNVSRSALQNDGFVKKISDYISKKVADKLSGMCKTDRENYEKYWDDISPFIKYGCLKDEKFCGRMLDYILLKNLDGKYLTLDDFIAENQKPAADASKAESAAQTNDTDTNTTQAEGTDTNAAQANGSDTVTSQAEGTDTVSESGNMESEKATETKSESDEPEFEEDLSNTDEEKEPKKTSLFYVTDEVQQSQYINMFKEAGLDAAILKHNIDAPFITLVERKKENVEFKRIDADVNDVFKDTVSEEEQKAAADTLTELFRKALGKEKLDVKVENLKNTGVASMITLSEESRRMQDMMKMYNMGGMDPEMFGGSETLVLNVKHELVQYILKHKDAEQVPMMCEQLYDLAMLSHAPLKPEAMTKFIARSNEIMMKLTRTTAE